MSMNVLQTIQQELQHSKYDYHQLIAPSIVPTWRKLSRELQQAHERKKGLQVPNFGKFSFVKDTLHPTFTLSEAYARRYRITFRRPPPAILLPTTNLHFATLADSKTSPDQAKSVIEYILEYVGKQLQSGRGAGRLKVGSVGNIVLEGNVLSFRYAKDSNSSSRQRPSISKQQTTLPIQEPTPRKGPSLGDLNLDSQPNKQHKHAASIELQTANLQLINQQKASRKKEKDQEIEDMIKDFARMNQDIEVEKVSREKVKKANRELAQKQRSQADEARARKNEEAQLQKSYSASYFPFRTSDEAAADRKQKNVEFRKQLDQQVREINASKQPKSTKGDQNLVKASSSSILPRFLLPERGPVEAQNQLNRSTTDKAYARYAEEKQARINEDKRLQQHLLERTERAEKRAVRKQLEDTKKIGEMYLHVQQQAEYKQKLMKEEKEERRRYQINASGKHFPVEKLRTKAQIKLEQQVIKNALEEQVREKRHLKEMERIVQQQEEQYFVESVKKQLCAEREHAKRVKQANRETILREWAQQRQS